MTIKQDLPRSPRRTLASARPQVRCAHCGLVVPAGLVEDGASEQYCCSGCRTAAGVVRACGLDAYYRLRESTDAKPRPVKLAGRAFAEFDDQTFTRLYTRDTGAGLREVDLCLEGVHCAACVWLLEKLPTVVPGVVECRVDVRRGMAKVRWEADAVPLSKIARTMDTLGYTPHPARDGATRALRRREDRRALVRIAIAGAVAGNVMLLAFALYGGVFGGIDAMWSEVFRWLSMGLGLISLLGPGMVFFRGAVSSLRTRTPHLDLPIAIALGMGTISGVINTITSSGEIYFDSMTALVFLLLVGRCFQQRQQRWAADALELLFSLTPGSARRVVSDGGGERVEEILCESLGIGDIVEVRPGESAPVDGCVVSGHSQIDRSLLTGESRPVSVEVGDRVPAGAVNLSGVLRLSVEAAGAATRVGKLMKLVSDAAARRAPLVARADRLGSIFAIVVLAIAGATLAGWLVVDATQAVGHAVAVLIVACPCALALATPMAVTVSIGRAASRGILVRGGDALERLTTPGVIFLDKTGTLTTGVMSVAEISGEELPLVLAGALERSSTHPIAAAIVRHAERLSDGGGLPTAIDARVTIGGGIVGLVRGQAVAVGSPAFVGGVLNGEGGEIAPEHRRAGERMAGDGLTPVVVAVNGRSATVIGLGDELRDGAEAAVERLRSDGWRVRLLSGDHAGPVRRIAERLGIAPGDWTAGASPEDKLERIRTAMRESGSERGGRSVVMIGDGVNDAAALAAASVGIAVHGGAEAALAAADAYIARPGLGPVVELLDGSRRTVRVIGRCLAASITYNCLGVGLAVVGLIHPIVAAALMPLSSVTVLTLAYRSGAFDRS